MFGLHLPSVPGQLRIVISYPTTTGQMFGLGYISYSQVKYWNQEKAERLKPQTARFEHGSVFVPWHCDRSCLSNKKGKQWHSIACNCIQGSTSQKYSGALRYLTSNKTAVTLSFAEICRSRLLYLQHTQTHTLVREQKDVWYWCGLDSYLHLSAPPSALWENQQC